MPIKVSIVEDDDQVRQSLTVLLNGSDGFGCVSAHRSAEEATMEIPLHVPDVVLMDINLPRQSGVECVRQLKTRMPQLQFLMLTMYEDADLIFNSLTAGASGYLLKRTSPSKLLEAIEEVHRGGAPMSSKIARIVVQHFQNQKGPAPETLVLSPREREVLDLLAKGHRYKEIAELLSISFDTVRAHLRNIYDKLQVRSRTEAVVKYLQH
ncbi:MAG: response regulator transcription factor [Limisphaerales bacterium]